jgi:hypothetical protein
VATFKLRTGAVPRGDLVQRLVAEGEPAAEPPADDVPTTGQTEVPTSAHWYVSIPAIALVLLGAALIVWQTTDPDYSKGSVAKAVEGLALFALFFVTAAALERFLEPIAALVPGIDRPTDDFEAKKEAAAKAVRGADEAAKNDPNRQTLLDTAKASLDEAAAAMAKVDRHKGDRTIGLWFIATILAIWASAALKLYFLRTVGIANVPRGLEILATGLIIGAGTKPLHDLVTGIQAKKDTAKADADTSAAV